jgi:hypothetical protein
MAKRMSYEEFYQEKRAWRKDLYNALTARGFRMQDSRRKFAPESTEGFSLQYSCKDPQESLKVLSKTMALLEKKGMKVGVEDEFDLNLQYVTQRFYVAVALVRTGVYFYFEERAGIDLRPRDTSKQPPDNLMVEFKPERVRARSG